MRRASPEAVQNRRTARRARINGAVKKVKTAIQNGINQVKDQVSNASEGVKAALAKLLGREPTQKDVDDYIKGDAAKDKAALDAIEKTAGAKSTTGGKFTFVELSKSQTDKCLTSFFFCNVDCASDFGMKCPGGSKIYSVFVPRQQHVDICVTPRAQNPIPELKSKIEYQHECMLRPCACNLYQNWFSREYGPDEFNQGMKMIQTQCQTWCTSGVKPPGMIDGQTAAAAIQRNKKSLIGKFGAFFGGIGEGIAKAAKAVGKAFAAAGKAIAQGVGKAGKAIGRVGRAIGRGVGKAARAVGRAFRRIGGGIRRFFRRRW